VSANADRSIKLVVVQSEVNEILGWRVIESMDEDTWPVSESDDWPWLPPASFARVERTLGAWIEDRRIEHFEFAHLDRIGRAHFGPGFRLAHVADYDDRLVRKVFGLRAAATVEEPPVSP